MAAHEQGDLDVEPVLRHRVPERLLGPPEPVVANSVIGFDVGDGHLHDASLIAALQRRCHVAPGEFVVAWVESQPWLPDGPVPLHPTWRRDPSAGVPTTEHPAAASAAPVPDGDRTLQA